MTVFSELYPEVIPGTIVTWISGSTIPDDMFFLECDGTVITIAPRYLPLVAVIGDMYGGDGVTDFGLPDYRGRFLRHRLASSVVGVEQSDGLKLHKHTASTSPYYTNSNVGSAYNANKSLRFNHHARVGGMNNTSGSNVGDEVLPKTMYVKYYIGY